ncbi:MAG: phosphoribosylformylglycinamidine cyclo-ligase [Leptospira sp.]|nr:phosphoribosylformylglycinamidine cyclo-ligase [Leptospira sp.]NCS93316.1 phosphoribosylformylglycinamidine cyclo-ligase [Leptospira sp.]
MNTKPLTYKDSGVDTEKGQVFVQNINRKVQETFDKNVLGGLGGFAASYDVSFLKDYKHPIMLSGTDGVGTKLEIARLLDFHSTVGIDLVAMCVNDLLVVGGKTLFFQDYISCGALNLPRMEAIVSGIVEGCKLANASLVGGETAEHPGLMEEDEYDLAGFAVGVVEKDEMITGSDIRPGDIVIGIESSGPHSNGFSLLRRLLLKEGKLPNSQIEIDFIRNFAMKPTTIYVPYIMELLNSVSPKGMVHITGGGFPENIPRVLKNGQGIELSKKLFPSNEFFSKLQKEHKLEDETMYSTFNMGVGFVIIVDKKDSEATLHSMKKQGLKSTIIGSVISNNGFHLLD